MSTPEASPEKPSQPVTLHRALGLAMAMAVVVGNVIGSGIFLKPGTIAAEGGNFALIMSVWVFGGLLCVLGALCFAELATMLPRAGGLYVYLREAYGQPVAFLYGWTEFLFARPAAIGALGVAFAGTLTLSLETAWGGSKSGAVFGETQREVIVVVFASVLIAGMAWVNIVGVLWGGRVQLVTTVFKAGGLALVALTPFVLIPFVSQSVELANYSTTVQPVKADLASRIGLVLLAVMWAYNGWHGVTPLAEEVHNPRRNIPLALFGGIGLLIALYVAANLAYHGVLSMSEMSARGEKASEFMLQKLFGLAGLSIMSSVIMCSTFGAINTNMLQAPRITFAMGRDGAFFRTLGHIHANYRTPAVAIFVTALMAIALVVIVAVAKYFVRIPSEAKSTAAVQDAATLMPLLIQSLRDGTIFKLLTNFVIFAVSIFYTLAVLAVIVLRIRRPDLQRPYKTLGYPVVPVFFIAVYVWFLYQIYRNNPLEANMGALLIALGIPVYVVYQSWSRRRQAADASGDSPR